MIKLHTGLVFLFLFTNILFADIEIWQAFSSNIYNTDQNIKTPPFNFQGRVSAEKDINTVVIKFFAYESEKRVVPLELYYKSNIEKKEAVFQGKVSILPGETQSEIIATLADNSILSKRMPLYNYKFIDNTAIKNYATLPSKKIHTDAVRSLVFTRDSRYLISGGDDNYVRILDAKSLNTIHELRGHSGYVRGVAVTHDNKYVLSGGSDGTLRVWDLKTGAKVKTIQAHKNMINAIAISNSGKYAVTCADLSLVSLWDLSTFEKVMDYEDCDSTLNYLCAVFTSDDRYVVIGDSDGLTTLFETTTGIAFIDAENDDEVVAVAMSPDMRHSYSADILGNVTYRKALLNPNVDDTVWLEEKDIWWDDLVKLAIPEIGPDAKSDSAHGKIRDNHFVLGLAPRIVYMGLTGDGKYLAMVSSQGKLRIKETHTGFKKYNKDLYIDATSGALSFDGKLCVVGELDGKIYLFGLP